MLDALLTELIEQQQFTTWRVRVAFIKPGLAQPADQKLLAGYRKLTATGTTKKALLQPQAGSPAG